MASTGNYVVTVWDTTPVIRDLTVNQLSAGALTTPYAQDQWNFSAAKDEQIRFRLVNTSAPGITFTLTGPNGYVAFTDASATSPLLTLPASGGYSLLAHSLGRTLGSYAFVVEQTSVMDLPLGTEFTGTLHSGEACLFRVDVPVNQVLSTVLSDAQTNDLVELYVRYGSPPTRELYDERYDSPGNRQQVVVPSATPGTWYVLAYGQFVASPTGAEYSLSASRTVARITSLVPTHAGNSQPIYVTVTGAGFDARTTVSLLAADGVTTIAPTSFTVDGFTQITATFPAEVAAGTYGARVERDGDVETLAAALVVTPGGQARLETQLVLPPALGRHALATLYVEVANTGDVAMPAPLLSLQSADADGSDRPILTLDHSRLIENFWSAGLPPGTSNSILLLGSGQQPGLLNPGERLRFPVYYLGLQQPWNFGDTQVELEVRFWTEDDYTVFACLRGLHSVSPCPRPDGVASSIDWAARRDDLRPPTLTDDQWNAIYDNLTGALPTTKEYVRMLNENARYLARLGEHVTDVDASLPSPGVALEFSRTYANSIYSHFVDGPFGRGWSVPWQSRLVSENVGALVRIVGQDGSARTFTRDMRNGNYFSGTGDSARLAVVAGTFELQTTGGMTTRFRADGRIDFVADANQNRVVAGYDANGRLTALTHSSGAALAIHYGPAGRITSIDDSAGRTTTYEYDPTGAYLTTVVTSDGKITRYAYQKTGPLQTLHALTSIERGGVTQSFTYDARGRLDASQLTGGAQSVDYSYDSAGLVTIDDDPNVPGATQLYFNQRGQLARVVDPLGRVTSNEFDDEFRLVRTVSPTGEAQSYSWCDCGSMTGVTNELGQTTAFEYASIGGTLMQRMTSFTDARGKTTRYAYDARGNLLTTTYPDGSVERLSGYTPEGLPGTSTNRRGQPLSYLYSPLGQVTRQTFADGSFITFEYDARGNLTTVTDGADVTSYAYDLATDGDRLTRVTYPGGRYLDYTYDQFGRRIAMVDQDGFATKYEYDAAGRLYRLRDAADTILVTYAYDAAGRQSRIDKGNGTFTTYEYDAAGQVLRLKNWRDETTLNSRFDYDYDARGRRIAMRTLDGDWTYIYDGSGQLTRAIFDSFDEQKIPHQDLQYFYDAAGNRTKTILNGETSLYVTNDLNQYVSVGGVPFTYDADGNLTSDGVNTYVYDQQNRLVRVSGPEGVTEYGYDAFGGLAYSDNSAETKEFLVDHLSAGVIVREYSQLTASPMQRAFGLGLTATVSPLEESHFADFDPNGTTVAFTDSVGNPVGERAYAPFGSRIDKGIEATDTSGFLGQWGVIQLSTDLHHTQYREYSSLLGRFLSIDPTGLLSGDTNGLRYAKNNPISFIDPNGLRSSDAPRTTRRTWDQSYAIANTAYANSWFERQISGAWGPVLPGIQDRLLQVKVEQGRDGNDFPLQDWWAYEDFIVRHLQVYGEAIWWIASAGNVGTNPFSPIDGFYGGGRESQTAQSFDPNAKTVGIGYGPEGFVTGDASLPYRIEFENKSTATAPAQTVTVSDFLAPDFDWNSFRLVEFGFGDMLVTIPAGSQHFQTTVSMTYQGRTFEVLVELGIRLATGEVFAIFQSVDPQTSLPPDVLTGFLPPEDGTGRGQGYFDFVVRPRAGLATGTQLRNVALIMFDQNERIATNQVSETDASLGTDPAKEALVTIDAVRPNSVVQTITSPEPSPTFDVAWSGTDDAGGSGVASFDILVSTDGGPFLPWQAAVTATSATFYGEFGRTYRFYSQARDHAGNVEAPPATFDAQIVVPPYDPASLTRFLVRQATLYDHSDNPSDADEPAVFLYRDYFAGGAFTNITASGLAPSGLDGDDADAARGFSSFRLSTTAPGRSCGSGIARATRCAIRAVSTADRGKRPAGRDPFVDRRRRSVAVVAVLRAGWLGCERFAGGFIGRT